MAMFACVWQGWRKGDGGGGGRKAMVATCLFLTLELDLRPTWCHLSGKLRACNHGGAKKGFVVGTGGTEFRAILRSFSSHQTCFLTA